MKKGSSRNRRKAPPRREAQPRREARPPRYGKENSGRYRRGNLRAIRRQPQLQKNRKSRGKSVNVRIW